MRFFLFLILLASTASAQVNNPSKVTANIAGEGLIEMSAGCVQTAGSGCVEVFSTGGGACDDYNTEVLADSPVGYWRLGESSGGDAFDETANSFDGTYENTVTYSATSLLSNDADTAIEFPGGASPGYVELDGGSTILGTAQDITLEAIINAQTLSGRRIIFELGGTGNGVSLQMNADTLFGVRSDGGTVTSLFTTLSTGTTYHVAFAIDSGTEMSLYVDGVEVADLTSGVSSSTNWGGDTAAIAAANGIRWQDGSQTSGSANPSERTGGFDGVIDEVAAYDSYLSGARILVHANAVDC